jgi:hypothetical protein
MFLGSLGICVLHVLFLVFNYFHTGGGKDTILLKKVSAYDALIFIHILE